MADETGVAVLQAASEGVVVADDRRVTFLGESFRVAEKVGLMPLMKFAHAASEGLDTSDMAALAAMYAMLRDCIQGDEWDRFERHAIEKKADGEDLFPVITETIELLTARPTQPPSASSNGRGRRSGSSTGSSSSRAATG